MGRHPDRSARLPLRVLGDAVAHLPRQVQSGTVILQVQGNFGVSEFKDGQFTAPHGAAIDSKGNLYVEDWNKLGRVSKLKKLG